MKRPYHRVFEACNWNMPTMTLTANMQLCRSMTFPLHLFWIQDKVSQCVSVVDICLDPYQVYPVVTHYWSHEHTKHKLQTKSLVHQTEDKIIQVNGYSEKKIPYNSCISIVDLVFDICIFFKTLWTVLLCVLWTLKLLREQLY